MTDHKYLKVSEAAVIFRRTEPTVRRWIAEGKLKALRFRSNYFIRESEVERILNQKGVIE